VDEPSPLAVGSLTHLEVVNRDCPLFAPCPARAQDVLGHEIDPPGVFDVTQIENQFGFTALVEGTALFSADVASSVEPRISFPWVAKTIDAVSVQTFCPSQSLMQVGVITVFDYEMRHGTERLHGRINPFTVAGGGEVLPRTYGEPDARLKLPVTPGEVIVTSPHDSTFEYRVDAVDRDSVDSIAIVNKNPGTVGVGAVLDLRADLLVGQRAICGGSMPITSTITTPDQCELELGYGTSSDTVRVITKAAGDCSVQVALVGTSLSATKTFVVM
jgi:hypothetical protein